MTQEIVLDRDEFNRRVEGLVEKAKKDLEAEGLSEQETVFSVELDMLYGGLVQVKRVSSPMVRIETPEQAQEVYDAFEEEFAAACSPHVVNKPGGGYIDGIVLKATVATEKMELATHELQGPDPGVARKGEREAYWPELDERVETTVYDFDALEPGHVIVGPGIVEMDYSTIVVPPGQHLRMDKHGLGIIEDVANVTEEAAS